ncbi:MAG: hypothetical protein IT182_17175 [Acidobacteria bacterium]|nr:hypothetical protein [Acidobacteriota bacterium]
MRRERGGPGGQALVGLILLVVGGLLFAQNLDVIDVRPYWRYWPVAPLAIGLFKLIAPGSRGDRILGLILTAFGGAHLARVLGYWSPRPPDLVALVLMAVGGYFVFRGLFGSRIPDAGPDSSETISGFTIMGGFGRTNNSKAFRGGDLTVFMGGCEIDLRQASMREPAAIDVFVMWGGVEVRVPEDWTVETRGTPLLGGFVDKTRPPAMATEKRLIVRGVALMGGVEVKN